VISACGTFPLAVWYAYFSLSHWTTKDIHVASHGTMPMMALQ